MYDSTPPSYSFHGSNSSHSKDNGKGGRTYHIPNYATRSVVTSQSNRPVRVNAANSYANDRSKLISIKFDEDKRTPRAIITVVLIFLLFAAVSLFVLPLHFAQVGPAVNPSDGSQSTVPSSGRGQGTNLSDRKEVTWRESSPRTTCSAGTQCFAETNVVEHGANRKIRTNQISRNVYWDEPKPSKRCTGFGARQYHARLWNLPFFSDWTGICEKTEMEIHGVILSKPSRCESQWPFGGVIGYWVVHFSEEDCVAHWGKFVDKGCIGQGKKRFQSRLRGIKSREDRMAICLTAPAVIQGKEFPSPMSCDDQGIWGLYGIWKVDDQKC